MASSRVATAEPDWALGVATGLRPVPEAMGRKEAVVKKNDPVFDVSGRTVVITGGMGQLGIAYTTAFAQRGAKVAVLDRTDKPKVRNAVFQRGLKSGAILPLTVDITNRAEVEKALVTIQRRLGKPAVLINNAALDSPPDAPPSEVGPYETYPEASYDKVMAVNVKGTHVCCQVFGGAMGKTGGGAIINISSIYGILSPCQDVYEFRRKKGQTFFKPVAYSISKSAVLNLTRYLATYWARKGVRVNTLTLAGVYNKQAPEFLKAYLGRMPLGRMAEAGDYIGPVLYLASDASRYMTGANLVVDGGWSAW